jgi:peptide/nickel transport system substrate-binding protein
MKKTISIFILVAAAAALVSAQTAKRGPIVDKVYIDVRMSQEIGLKDTAEGKTDVFYEYVTGPTYSALPADTKAKLEAYAVPALTYSLFMNPIPNKAPYTVKVGEKTVFNPLAITEVRFAMNFLISRQQIVDEILGGNGQPMFTMASPGQPAPTGTTSSLQSSASPRPATRRRRSRTSPTPSPKPRSSPR